MPNLIPESCEALLQRTVGYNTVNTHISGKPHAERELACYLDEVARQMGLTTRRLPVAGDDFTLLVSCEVNDASPWVLFESHLDTVSVAGMTVAPFDGRIENGRIFGRGACDTKGTGAAMLWALRRYAESNDRPNNVAIAYTLDEEIGKTGIRAFVERQMPTLGWRPVGVIVGEPTELAPVVAHNGLVRWTIRTRGLAAHSSNPARGRSAISMMVRIVDAIESRYIPRLDASHPMTGRAQCSVNVIRGGTQINIVPDACEIQIDRRVVPGEDPHTVLPDIDRLLNELRGNDPTIDATQGPPYIDPPLDPAASAWFAARVGKTLAAMGLPAEPVGVAYATNASNFAGAGVPAVVLGPGSIAQAHTCDEWLALDQLRLGVDVYLNLMRTPWEGTS